MALAQISVNISALEFLRPDFVCRVETMLHAVDLAPQRLTLELTESMLMDDAEGAVRTLTALKALGVRLALDDFGTGYSSLSYLRRFPLDAIKIDRSFVRDIAVDASTAAIVDATIRMAHSLNLDVVGEGVETEAQLAELAARGCDQAQGYLFSAPVLAEDLAALRGWGWCDGICLLGGTHDDLDPADRGTRTVEAEGDRSELGCSVEIPDRDLPGALEVRRGLGGDRGAFLFPGKSSRNLQSGFFGKADFHGLRSPIPPKT